MITTKVMIINLVIQLLIFLYLKEKRSTLPLIVLIILLIISVIGAFLGTIYLGNSIAGNI